MPVQPGKGTLASLPGGALQVDVDPSTTSGAVSIPGPTVTSFGTIPGGGVQVMPQFGLEACMVAAPSPVSVATGFQPLTFTSVEWDENEWDSALACDPLSGLFTIRREGMYEVGITLGFTPSTPYSSGRNVQLGIWTDFGYPGLPLAPAIAFGTQNSPVGAAWQRIGMFSQGTGLSPDAQLSTAPTLSDAPCHIIAASRMWPVHAPLSPYLHASAAPTRFRFAIRTDLSSGLTIFGSNDFQTRAWLRWLGHTP